MATDIRVPVLGESITEATVGHWLKQAGDAVSADEPLVELETDKVTVEVPAPVSGVLAEIIVKEGDTVAVGALLGAIVAGDGKPVPAAKAEASAPIDTPKTPEAFAPAPAPAAQPAEVAAAPVSPPAAPVSSASVSSATSDRRSIFDRQ